MGDEGGLLLGEVLLDDTPCRGVDAGVGDLDPLRLELLVQILRVAERSAEEEVLPDVAIGPLDLARPPWALDRWRLPGVSVHRVGGESDVGEVAIGMCG